MNKEVSLKSDLKIFNIDIDDIEFNPHFFEALQEAIAKMREETLLKNLKVVLNNNLIEAIYKPTNYRTILGCRVSYDDLPKDVSFIVRPDDKPSYEKLEEENKSLQSQLKAKEEVIKKFEKYLNDCVSELENNYGTSSIQNAINTGIVDITKVILSKFNEILSKGENK